MIKTKASEHVKVDAHFNEYLMDRVLCNFSQLVVQFLVTWIVQFKRSKLGGILYYGHFKHLDSPVCISESFGYKNDQFQ